MTTRISILAFLAIASVTAFAHEQSKHKEAVASAEPKAEAVISINEEYLREVKPIFQTSCMNCHSEQTEYPWYSNLPFARSLIKEDIEEARKHLDIGGDFPFRGHGSPVQDLEAIKASIEEGAMPPLRYEIMHWGSWLTDLEKAKILQWVEQSLEKLRGND